jgi:hypothetical protein
MVISAEQGTIRIRRAAGYRDKLRNYKVNVDGKRVGILRPNGVFETTVEPGRHVVRATIAWTGSPEVPVTPGGLASLTASPRSPFGAIPDVFSRTRWIDLSNDGGAPGGPRGWL